MPRTLSATGPEQGGASLLGPRPAEGEAGLLPGAPPRSANTFVGRRREGKEGGAASKRRTPNSYRRTWGRAPLVRGGGGGGGSRRASGRWKFESSRVASCPGGAKEPSAAAAMDDFAEEESCDFDLLPALSEDEENVSLADVLSLQDSCLTEQAIWAICLECTLSLKNIVQSAIFQTLCITPDTLAFNTNGNVCFMEQISDDPEGAFVPPEIDETGNTFEAHLYSLGATLTAALEYTMETEADLEFSQDLYALLGQMQKENPKERPDVEVVISLCKEKLKFSSPSDICQALSAAGRKMLSIESCGTFQDSSDNMWEETLYENPSPYEERLDDTRTEAETRTPSPEDLMFARNENSSGTYAPNDRNSDIKSMKINKKEERVCCQSISTWVTKSQERSGSMKYNRELDAKPYATGVETDTFERYCLRKVRTFPTVSFNSETPSRACLSFIGHNTSLTRTQCQLQPGCNESAMLEGKLIQCDHPESKSASLPHNNFGELYLSPDTSSVYPNHMTSSNDKEAVDILPYCYAVSETSGQNNPSDATDETNPGCNALENYCWVFLKHLLIQYGKPLKDYELWALCHECLLTLEKYTDYPAYLCLDSVAINHDGSITFVPYGNEESLDRFYLAPEAAEEGFITEKACIYCMAAILWRAARSNFPPDHKLVLPGQLKHFLLNMARSKPEDRPSLANAIKICRSYLLEQNISSKMILEVLAKMAFQDFRGEDSFNVSWPFQNESCSGNANLGFLPMSNESKLIAVEGPVPCQSPLNREKIMLPNAFTSSATHFKPIILHQNVNHKIPSFNFTLLSWSSDWGWLPTMSLYRDAITTPVIDCETMTRIASVSSRSPIHSSNDNENKSDEISNLSTTCMMPGALEHNKEEPKILQQDSEEEFPSNTNCSNPNLPVSDSSDVPQEKCILEASPLANPESTVPSSMTFINNFLLKQDPETRVLTLVPVQIAVSEQIPNKPLHSKATYSCCPSLHVLLSEPAMTYDANRALQTSLSLSNAIKDQFYHDQNKCGDIKVKMGGLTPTTINKETQTKCYESNPCLASWKKSSTDAEDRFLLSDHALDALVDQNSAGSFILETSQQNKGTQNVPLQNIVQLIQEEFAFDKSQDKVAEALAIGKYIFTLKDLQYNTFCNAVSEKFCQLYWDEKLLANLYGAANDRTVVPERINEPQYLSKTFQSTPNTFLSGSEEAKVHVAGMDSDEKEVETQTLLVGMQMEGESLQTEKGCSRPHVTETEQKQEEIQERMEENIYSSSSSLSELPGFYPGWSSAFYGSEWFSLDVHNYFRKLGKQKARGTQNIDAKKMELDQLIMIETKNYRKTITFHQRLLYKERSSKGGEIKALLPKLERQIEEMKSKIQFLELVKKYLQILYAEKWGVEPCNFLTVVNMGRNEPSDISALDGMLLFYHLSKTPSEIQYNDSQNCPRSLQAGTPLALMAYLYSRNAFLKGYVQQFLFTFRYFCSQEELLQFILDRIRITLPGSSPESCSLFSKIYHRSFSILQAWIEDCYTVDFSINPNFMQILKDFIISQVVPLNGCGRQLLSLLNNVASKKERNVSQFCKMEVWEQEMERRETRSLRFSCKRDTGNVLQKHLSRRLSKGTESQLCYRPATEELSGFCLNIAEAPYFLTEYTAQQLYCQLTLLEQEIFHKCHPVHFLNSRLLGVNDKTMLLPKASSSELLSSPAYNLFVKNCVQDDYLLQLLKYADNISTWVAAEIVSSCSSKVQMNLVSKFLFTAKCCYKQRNFATAMQILRGLENLIVRQLPIWKSLPSKVSDILEELKAVEVFLKSDSLCLMEGERFKTSPTIPSAHILTMHIQQLETGGFTMRNGTYKWTKLRNIAKVVSQVQAFQENPYMFPPDCQLQDFLRQRIAFLNDADIFALAADNYANFHQKPEKQSRKIQDALHRMKAMFQ
ncbi:kinase non-catalytic C-lobe domain-containing protein 1 isoform X3 [Crotalus tigris]|uniref:kinase non-catalytic C-lobe domain-containing protein 1 isoform X3 n=1 Tax=Crotalus tigris TaxID=88082 RepID=UPI00192F5D79|nr:kinase non-catalytic C-lobe domain-containing protein 1 isoform X3 [Crotalus tigris]